MRYEQVSVSERRTMPPAIAVSAVGFAIAPPAGALLGDVALLGNTGTDAGAGINTDATGEQRAAETTLWIPLVRRTREPFAGCWALPGGPTEWHETLAGTALRTLTAAALREPGYLEQLYAFGAVERSAQAQRLVTIAYWAQYGERDLEAEPIHPPTPQATDTGGTAAPRARWDDPVSLAPLMPMEPAPTTTSPANPAAPDLNVAWFSADRLPKLAFDHAEIVEYALWRLRVKTEYSSVAHRFLGPEFTLAQLRRVHEAILGQAVDPANFRRQSLASGHLVETGDYLTGSAHRPARLYRFREDGTPPSDRPAPQPTTKPHTQPHTQIMQGSMQ